MEFKKIQKACKCNSRSRKRPRKDAQRTVQQRSHVQCMSRRRQRLEGDGTLHSPTGDGGERPAGARNRAWLQCPQAMWRLPQQQNWPTAGRCCDERGCGADSCGLRSGGGQHGRDLSAAWWPLLPPGPPSCWVSVRTHFWCQGPAEAPITGAPGSGAPVCPEPGLGQPLPTPALVPSPSHSVLLDPQPPSLCFSES